jgi:GNAT superfamily N-acetyltransferase
MAETVAMLARAYSADPFLTWAGGETGLRMADLVSYHRRLIQSHLRHGTVTVGDRTRNIVGAAVWAPSDHVVPTLRRRATQTVSMAMRGGLGTAQRLAGRRLRGLRPSRRHRHLIELGVDPSDRHQGVGKRLLAAGLALCDAAMIPAYAEVCDPEGAAFMERFGFDTYDEDMLEAGTTVRRMWREPA